MSEVKAGDRVWVKREVSRNSADGYIGVDRIWLDHANDAIPDSPALPAVARWLAEQQAAGVNVYAALDECMYSASKDIELDMASFACLRALVAALATAAADGGAG